MPYNKHEIHFSVTIHCDFEAEDVCDWTITTNGDDASQKGFEWIRHSGKWIQDHSMEGPYKGTI